ncbi:MAG: MerR family transcriptional regulator [Sedimenticola sp.]
MGNGTYKIGEVASLLATSIRTIRYYEEEFLIEPIRTEKGTRLYSDSHILRLKAILNLTHNGFSIETIREISTIRDKFSTGKESSHHLSALFDKSLSTLQKQIQALDSLRNEIQSTKEIIQSCSDCNNKPSTNGCPDCLVIKKLDEVLLLNLVWDAGL